MSATSTFIQVLVALCLFSLFTAGVEGAANTTCPAPCDPCTGSDAGGCCSQYFDFLDRTYCDPYCMVADYQCCGCVAVNATQDIFECYSCPKGQACIENSRHLNPLPNNQTGWYCASGSALAPSRYLVAVAVALLLFVAFADSFVSVAAFLDSKL
ncbi:uncharacterized protein ACA1_097650 [Acanthamoeba castellanii str. Neff]|uniref:Uncharacterized protein n=1 Tax=Acanthamoeba castellanii (strain ATCC 30010 / Neff) TaxID=1257118 RepID=L8GJU4_ACACF|nr:uncharacterized protein ACA1_097650 [Acanthamoeba castellanii str. Neff]ELR13079.1 hypothetical protein ACA1_097650 [Acanthamoeba castellanii str. Neff]